MRRGLSSVRGFVLVVLAMLVVALVLVYAAVTSDRELPSTFLRYVLAPLVVGLGAALSHLLGGRPSRGPRPLPASASRPRKAG